MSHAEPRAHLGERRRAEQQRRICRGLARAQLKREETRAHVGRREARVVGTELPRRLRVVVGRVRSEREHGVVAHAEPVRGGVAVGREARAVGVAVRLRERRSGALRIEHIGVGRLQRRERLERG